MAPRSGSEPDPAAQLELGEIIVYPTCPFPLPEGDDRQFLLVQRLGGRTHKNISYNPRTGRVAGYRAHTAGQAERLHALLASFASAATTWLAGVLPRYAIAWEL